MKKRFLASIIAFCMLCSTSAFASTPTAGIVEPIKIIAFEDYSATEDTLTSKTVLDINSTSTSIRSGNNLQIKGSIPKGNQYDISINIRNGEFAEAVEKNNNYTVLSVISFEDIVRIILKDNNKKNMYYIELNAGNFASVEPYNTNWYHSFLAPQIETLDLPEPYTLTSSTKNFSTSTTIYGDQYVEILS